MFKYSIDNDIFNKVLFTKNTTEPTNYTIIFQFDSPGYAPNIEYYNFSVTAVSWIAPHSFSSTLEL